MKLKKWVIPVIIILVLAVSWMLFVKPKNSSINIVDEDIAEPEVIQEVAESDSPEIIDAGEESESIIEQNQEAILDTVVTDEFEIEVGETEEVNGF